MTGQAIIKHIDTLLSSPTANDSFDDRLEQFAVDHSITLGTNDKAAMAELTEGSSMCRVSISGQNAVGERNKVISAPLNFVKSAFESFALSKGYPDEILQETIVLNQPKILFLSPTSKSGHKQRANFKLPRKNTDLLRKMGGQI